MALVTGLISPASAALVGKAINVFTGLTIYVDGEQMHPTDANGNPVETFVYNGTTYVPLRAISQYLGKNVSYDGKTQTVSIGNKPGSIQYLMDVCPPYQAPNRDYDVFTQGKSFAMAGQKYTNGFCLGGTDASVLFNLNGQYTTVELTVGHWDGYSSDKKTAYFYLDGQLIYETTVEKEGMPQHISLPVSGGLQFKISIAGSYSYNNLGFGNITVK